MERDQFGDPGVNWKDNIMIDLQEVVCVGMDWTDLAQDRNRGAGTCECGNESSVPIKRGKFLD
jgi:hypothetical protein